MILKLVVLASCMMLAIAQPKFRFHRPRFSRGSFYVRPHPFSSMPISQHFMTQTAHSILNEHGSIPLSPGVLSGHPVLVNEATQSILDQEAKVIGYSLSPGPGLPPPIGQRLVSRLQSSQYFPVVTPFTIQKGAGSGYLPKSLTAPGIDKNYPKFPTYNENIISANSQESASLKDRLVQQLAPIQFKSAVDSSFGSVPRDNIYYDIPPNHPVPQPLLHHNIPAQNTSSEPTRQSRPSPNTATNLLKQGIKQAETRDSLNDVVYMRPPLLLEESQKSQRDNELRRPQPPKDSSRHQASKGPTQEAQSSNIWNQFTYKPPTHESKDSSLEGNKYARPVKEALTNLYTNLRQEFESGKSAMSFRHERDSSSEGSENSYQQVFEPSGNQPLLNYDGLSSYNQPPPPLESNSGYPRASSKGIVHKHIFVHSAPPTYDHVPQVRVIRPAPSPDKHIQVIFVKSPVEPQPQTVVELPKPNPTKTVVYVLSKNQESKNEVKVIAPAPTKPPSPEIYFIRYGDNKHSQGYPVADLKSLYNDNYGIRNQPHGTSYDPGNLRSKRNKEGLGTYAPLMSYSTSGQINEITNEEADFRRVNLDSFF